VRQVVRRGVAIVEVNLQTEVYKLNVGIVHVRMLDHNVSAPCVASCGKVPTVMFPAIVVSPGSKFILVD
jgi:hypothetical protein